MVRVDLDPAIDYMKTLNKSKLPYLFEHVSNVVPSVQISFSYHRFFLIAFIVTKSHQASYLLHASS